MPTASCAVCTTDFEDPSPGTPKTTCSRECRRRFRSRHRRDTNRARKSFVNRQCASCGHGFECEDYRGLPAYCSAACRATAHLFRTIRRRYGITRAEWLALFESQGKCCAVCGTTSPGRKTWSTDHDHRTRKVRGILCSRCNTGIGLFGENEEALSSAVEYLRKHRELKSVGS